MLAIVNTRMGILVAISFLTGICDAQSTTAPATTAPNKYGIILGHDTTVLTGPLRPDGTIDFFKAVNDHIRQQVTPETNAAALLIRIVPPDGTPKDPAWAQIRNLLGLNENSHDEIAWHNLPAVQPPELQETAEQRQKYQKAMTQPWSTEDLPRLALWLKLNEEAINLATQASKRPGFWFPIVPRKSEDPLLIDSRPPEFSTWRQLMEALSIRAMLKLQQGDSVGAGQNLIAMHRLTSMIARTPQFLDNLWAAGWQYSACKSDQALLRQGHLTSDQLRGTLSDLQALNIIPDPRGECGQVTRYEFVEGIEKVAVTWAEEWQKHFDAESTKKAQGILADAGLPWPDWNRILRLGNAWYDDFLMDDWRLPPDQMEIHRKDLRDRMDKMQKVWNEADPLQISSKTVKDAWLFPLAGESQATYSDRIGTVILLTVMPSINRASGNVRSSNLHLEWLKVAFNLAIFHQDHGRYPASLDELIPNYLPRLPASPTTRPVSYKTSGAGYVMTTLPVVSPTTTEKSQANNPEEILIEMDE